MEAHDAEFGIALLFEKRNEDQSRKRPSERTIIIRFHKA